MKIDFNEFLSEKHFEENPQILDDYLSDAFEDWLTNLDPQEFIDYGQEYAELINKEPCDIENSYASEDDYLQSCGRL